MIFTPTLTALSLAAAYRPFLDPLDLHDHWLWLILPLVFAVSLVYKTLKLPTLDGLLLHTLRMSLYLLLFMAAVGAALWVITEAV